MGIKLGPGGVCLVAGDILATLAATSILTLPHWIGSPPSTDGRWTPPPAAWVLAFVAAVWEIVWAGLWMSLRGYAKPVGPDVLRSRVFAVAIGSLGIGMIAYPFVWFDIEKVMFVPGQWAFGAILVIGANKLAMRSGTGQPETIEASQAHIVVKPKALPPEGIVADTLRCGLAAFCGVTFLAFAMVLYSLTTCPRC